MKPEKERDLSGFLPSAGQSQAPSLFCVCQPQDTSLIFGLIDSLIDPKEFRKESLKHQKDP